MVKLLSIISLILAIILFPPATLAVISNNAVPGDATYPIKRGLEDIIFAVVSINPTTKAWFSAARSDRRFKEFSTLITQGKEAGETLNELVEQTNITANQIAQVTDQTQRGKLIEQLSQSIDKYDQGLRQFTPPSSPPTSSPSPAGATPPTTPLQSPSPSVPSHPTPTSVPVQPTVPVVQPTPRPSLVPQPSPTPTTSQDQDRERQRQREIEEARRRLEEIRRRLERQQRRQDEGEHRFSNEDRPSIRQENREESKPEMRQNEEKSESEKSKDKKGSKE